MTEYLLITGNNGGLEIDYKVNLTKVKTKLSKARTAWLKCCYLKCPVCASIDVRKGSYYTAISKTGRITTMTTMCKKKITFFTGVVTSIPKSVKFSTRVQCKYYVPSPKRS